MRTETYIVLVDVKSTSIDRSDLDNASCHIWDSKEHFINKLCEHNPEEASEVRLIPVYEFADWWNDQDNDTLEEDKIEPLLGNTWMGYCIIKKD